MRRCLTVLLLALALPVSAEPGDSPLAQEVVRARGEVANELQLWAYDLVDELVYGWTQRPVFDDATPVVLTEVSVPVGMGSGLMALVENHVASVVGTNPNTHVQLVHCPQCTAVVVRSDAASTQVSRGYDDPAVLAGLAGDGRRHALFLDFEVHGGELVLRARLTGLTPDLPIVWARTLTTALDTPPLLRATDPITSAEDARQQYLDILQGRSTLRLPLRFTVRSFAQPYEDDGVPPPPFLWIQTGIELATTHDRRWLASMTVGGTHVPVAYSGLMAETRINRLLTGKSRSLTRPDLYLFVGGGVATVWGLAAASFQNDVPDVDASIAVLLERDPRTTLGMLSLGLDLRVGQRIGIAGFVETLPGRGTSRNLGAFWAGLPAVPIHTLGTEVSLWF